MSDIWMSVCTCPLATFYPWEENPRLALKLLVIAHEILEKPTSEHQVVYPIRGAGHHRVSDQLRECLPFGLQGL